MIDPKELVDKQDWAKSSISFDEFKSFLVLDNVHGLFHIGLWLLLLVSSGALAFSLRGTDWVVPAFLLYGMIYAGGNCRWHEASHGTVFKTPWLNTLLYYVTSSMEFRDPVDFRWSHARHHSYTLIDGVDPEIPTESPPNLVEMLLNLLWIKEGVVSIKNLILHALAIPSRRVKDYVPESRYPEMFRAARIVLLPHLLVLAAAIGFQSWMPVLFYGLPRMYGSVLASLFIWLQHVGMPHGVWDHRKNCRTLELNSTLSFMFMNMENHIEHHMYPRVPFHALPKLHRRIQNELPPSYIGITQALGEMFSIVGKQQKDPSFALSRNIPVPGPAE